MDMRLRMETPPQVPAGRSSKGTAGLIFALIIVLVAAVMSSAARWFIAISIPIGLIAALVLRLWNKYRPVKPEDVDKRPLKLD
ncbi:MAG TPA: hypothetical protein VKW78_16330 [Terriglobales bacterium]|nr:hypothetical protein [Terriglobales bacterium]